MTVYCSVPFAVGATRPVLSVSAPVPGEEIKTIVGRRGLLGLRAEALAAVGLVELMRAFGRPDLWGRPPQVGIIACTATGADCAVTEVNSLSRAGDGRKISILDAPNVSPNVVSSVASIRIGAQGPCFTLDESNGAAKMLRLAIALLDAGRCTTVLALDTWRGAGAEGVGVILSSHPTPAGVFALEADAATDTLDVEQKLTLLDLVDACAATLRSKKDTVNTFSDYRVRRVPTGGERDE